MIEKNIIQAALASIKMFDGAKTKFEVWIESINNAVPISGQNAIFIACSKFTGSLLLTAKRLKMKSPKPNIGRMYACNISLFHPILIQPRLSPICNKVQMSFSIITYTM